MLALCQDPLLACRAVSDTVISPEQAGEADQPYHKHLSCTCWAVPCLETASTVASGEHLNG